MIFVSRIISPPGMRDGNEWNAYLDKAPIELCQTFLLEQYSPFTTDQVYFRGYERENSILARGLLSS